MPEGLEHDTAEEAAATGKAMKAPVQDKAMHEPPASKAHDTRRQMRASAGQEDRPWLHPENPEIWDGEHDSE